MHPKYESDGDFNFSLEPRTFGPFTIGADQFMLREASEAAHTAYKNVTMRGLRITGEKTGEFAGGAEADTLLVTKCLFKLTPGATAAPAGDGLSIKSAVPLESPVTLEFVQGLPRRITSRLYNKVRELSGMDEEQETDEFLSKRIASDTTKLDRLRVAGSPGKDEPSSTLRTS